jgi:hypothetical protein
MLNAVRCIEVGIEGWGYSVPYGAVPTIHHPPVVVFVIE